MNQKGNIVIIVLVVLLLFVGVAGYIVVKENIVAPKIVPPSHPVPKPTPSPTPTPTGKEVTLREGQREGPFQLQKIYSDYVTGLQFREYPIATSEGYPITIHIGDTVSNGCTVTLTLVRITVTTAVFSETINENRLCPICLATNTLINTPSGPIAVQTLHTGDMVWTTDKNGKRITTRIIKTSRTPVLASHQVVHVVLADGRELSASPGHPTADGRQIGTLKVGDILDGAYVRSVQLITYTDGFTYDILPAGDTASYWADGILIGSTLR